MSMNVTISVSGSFPAAYHFGRYLEEQGRLTRLITPLPFSRTRRFGVSQARTRSLWVIGGVHYLNFVHAPVAVRPWTQYLTHLAYDHAAALQIGEPDIVNVWAANALATIRRAHRLGVKAVLHTGSTHIEWQTENLQEEFARHGFKGAITRKELVQRTIVEYEEADAIVVPSRVARDTFLAKGTPDAKLHIVQWGGKPVTAAPVARPARDKPRILYVGNCSILKGIPYLFNAFKRLNGRATLRLVGPVEPGALAAAGGVPEGVEVVGPRRGDSLAQEYREADAFVIASIEEGSAFVVMEAMAAGLPVVVSDRVGADQVRDGINGFIVPARDAVALGDRLRELVEDSELRDRIGRAAASSVEARGWREYGADLDARVFQPLLKGIVA